MNSKLRNLLAVGLILSCAGGASSALAGGQSLGILDTLQRGIWKLRPTPGTTAPAAVSQLCLGDPARLTQIQHGDIDCNRFIVKSTPTTLVVSYSCDGQGQGLTTIRRENSDLIQIQSQGIRNGAPFSFSVEGRRTAGC